MNLKRLFFITLCGIMLLLVACASGNRIRGNGTITTQQFDISDFSQLLIANSGRITLTQGETPQLAVTTDENLMQYVTVTNTEDALSLKIQEGVAIIPTDEVHYEVTVVDLERIFVDGSSQTAAEALTANALAVELDGSGSITIDALTAETLAVSQRGSGSITLAGSVESQTVELNGSGRVNLGALATNTAVINLDGSGTIIVWAAETLNAALKGSGTINYVGSPDLTETIDGSGTIQPAPQNQR